MQQQAQRQAQQQAQQAQLTQKAEQAQQAQLAQWMLALMVTNNRGAPQGWVQDGMCGATWAVFIRFFMVLMVGSTTGAGRVPVDKDGTPMWEPTVTAFSYVALASKWITGTFLYGGIIAAMEPSARGCGRS